MGSLITSSSSAGPIQISKFPEPWYPHNIFLISRWIHMLWVLIRSASLRSFWWVHTTYFLWKNKNYTSVFRMKKAPCLLLRTFSVNMVLQDQITWCHWSIHVLLTIWFQGRYGNSLLPPNTNMKSSCFHLIQIKYCSKQIQRIYVPFRNRSKWTGQQGSHYLF